MVGEPPIRRPLTNSVRAPDPEAQLGGRARNAAVEETNMAVKAARHYQALRKRWIEFLGEKADSATNRTEETHVNAA